MGLSDLVVVVEAAEKSGALITTRHALDAGRDVWALPGPLDLTECHGSNALLSDGAGVPWDVERFVEAVPPSRPCVDSPSRKTRPRRPEPVPAGLPEKEAAALADVGFEPIGVDAVARRVASSGIEMHATFYRRLGAPGAKVLGHP